MSDLVPIRKDGEILVIEINNPPVNALSPGVPEGILSGIRQAKEDASVEGVVLIGGGRTFIAGADIKEFGKITSGGRRRDAAGLNPVLNEIEASPKPVVAALHGTAFGGGLEFAMACHWRVAVADAQVGQPEVKLGIIPGAGGTQRLPRLAGVPKALEMCAQGEPVRAPEALKLGIIDQIVEGNLLEGALAFLRRKIAEGVTPRRTRDLKDRLGNEATNAAVFALAREMARKQARGLMAPFKAIDAVEAATKLPFDEGLARESELFQECLLSPQSKALIHIFFGERAVAKVPGLPKDTPIRAIKKAAVVGAGTMGGGIAMVYANAGIPVLLKEVTQELLERGLEVVRKNYGGSVQKGRMTPAEMDQRLGLIQPTLDYEAFGDVDIVVEAVFEDMAIKKQVFAELDRAVKPEAILASNTSTLDIDEIAAATSRPDRVIGHHFFSPAHVMRLLEIVRGRSTAPEVIATSMDLARRLRKVGVLVGNCRGFVGNRMLAPYGREAQFLVEEGARVEEVDAALEGFGLAMGYFRMADLAGVDVGWRVKEAHKHLVLPGTRVPLMVDHLYQLGRHGQKTGKGWYRYESGSRAAIPDPEVAGLIVKVAREAGIEQRKIPPEELLERPLYALINEGARILEEGMALRAVDIDIIYVYGYGFPPAHGGPMFYADQVGLKPIYDRIVEFESRHGEAWAPAGLLKRLAEEGKSFADFDKAAALGA